MHIVLVEDDEVIRETTQISLERFGYTVTAFEDGREGYEFVATHGADAVLLDLMLPTMNGASITRAIRERSSVPIIVISARSEPIDIVQALEAGADDYLTKPFDMQVLNARIRSVVRRFITAGTGSMGHSPTAAMVGRSSGETTIGPGGRIIGGSVVPDVLGPTPGFDSSPRAPETQDIADTGTPAASHPHIDFSPPFSGSQPHHSSATTTPGGPLPPQHAPHPHISPDSYPHISPAPNISSAPNAPAAGSATTSDADSHPSAARRIRLGSLTIDTGRLTVEIDGEEVHLTPTELRILMLLTEEPGHVYSREKMAYTVWGYQWAGDSRVVDVHIQRLRKKIGARRVETVRGFGYRFAG